MKERDKEGLQNAARFAIQPNMWGFCGEDESQEILRNFVAERDTDQDIVRETLVNHGFPHLNSFLATISAASGLDEFDDEVVMSYWLGSYLTEKIGTNTKETLVANYEKQISGDFAEQLEKVLPEKIYLTHLSQVALIAASDYDQPQKTELINHCMIAYGKITAVDAEKRMAKVSREILKAGKEGGFEVVLKNQSVKIDIDLTPDLKIGDDVTVHLGYVAAKIDDGQAEQLRYWTRRVAESI